MAWLLGCAAESVRSIQDIFWLTKAILLTERSQHLKKMAG